MQQDVPPTELRAMRRQRVLKQGKILTRNNMSIIDCVVRDLSAKGARLVCGDQAAVPNTFRFVTPADGLMWDAQVSWRRGDVIGVTFAGDPRPAPPRKW